MNTSTSKPPRTTGPIKVALVAVLFSALPAGCDPPGQSGVGDFSPPSASKRLDPHDSLASVPASASTNAALPANTLNLMASTLNADELKAQALGLAAGSDAGQIEALGRYLTDPAFLSRLDSPEEYQGTYVTLRLSQVVKRLSENPSPDARRVLVALAVSQEFTGHILRLQLLIRALAKVEQPAPTVLAFWDKFSQPESPIAFDVIEALCVNQSASALELLERKFANPKQPQAQCLAWLRQIILPRRNDEALLSGCEHMLTHSLPASLKAPLVEALFDYRPEWYVGDDPPQPPPRAEASSAARKVLARIGGYALDQRWLNAAQRRVVKRVLAEIRH